MITTLPLANMALCRCNHHVGAVSASAGHDNCHCLVADQRLPEPNDKLVGVIRALIGTWHNPFTIFELAALQGLVAPCEHLELEGLSDRAWRERINNAVPAAEAITSVMSTNLLLAWFGETFAQGSTPIWVRNVAWPPVYRSKSLLYRSLVYLSDY